MCLIVVHDNDDGQKGEQAQRRGGHEVEWFASKILLRKREHQI
jgi:hypothetical protein